MVYRKALVYPVLFVYLNFSTVKLIIFIAKYKYNTENC